MDDIKTQAKLGKLITEYCAELKKDVAELSKAHNSILQLMEVAENTNALSLHYVILNFAGCIERLRKAAEQHEQETLDILLGDKAKC